MKGIYKPENGIYGYTPLSENDVIRTNGNNMYYSSINADSSVNISRIKSCILQNLVMGDQIHSEKETTKYKDGDLVLTMDGSIYLMNSVSSNPTLERVSSIKIHENEHSDISLQSVYIIILDKIDRSNQNNYNYVKHCESPLYHHRDCKDSSVYGNYIQFKTDLSDIVEQFDDSCVKLVINFISGMRFEKIISSDTFMDPIFIDNRYFLSYGHSSTAYDNEHFPRIKSYDLEIDKKISQVLTRNLYTNENLCMIDGYIEYFYNGINYRTPIVIQ